MLRSNADMDLLHFVALLHVVHYCICASARFLLAYLYM